jgi:uncharacterized membrane protein
MMKHVYRHARLLISVFTGGVLFLLLPRDWTVLTRVLVSWNVGVPMFLLLALRLMTKLNADQISERYKEEDETAPLILIISVIGAMLTVASIVAFLSTLDTVREPQKSLHIALAALTVVHSWILIPTMFTLHYADMFYSAESDSRPLCFPDDALPVFWDFAYFSFTIAAACQTADVSTNQGTIRKVVLAHSVLSFFFNASILGFAINVTAGLIGTH